jgi:GH24 family phage-related lysozyme (muramidase)
MKKMMIVGAMLMTLGFSYADGKEMTKRFEGWRETPYYDTRGVLTVGYGFTQAVTLPAEVWALKRPLKRKEGDQAFDVAYREAEKRAERFAGTTFSSLPTAQRAVLIDMSYNLGNRLFAFKNFQKFLRDNNVLRAREEMIDSAWYKQVGNRAEELVKLWA